MHKTYNVNVSATTRLVTPREIKSDLPITKDAIQSVLEGRQAIERILRKEDERLLVVVGPCSIHDQDSALEYAERLVGLRERVGDQLYLVMRTYFEKPRTTVGWKGLVNDPHLDGTYDMETGLRRARELLLKIAHMGLPTATEVLDTIVPQYLSDLESWVAIGARTIESQTHRELASGLSMPVGFKNSTDGNLQLAINAFLSARQAHHFLGIDEEGHTCIIATKGNPYGHVILRGGHDRPNYDPVSVLRAQEQLKKAGLPPLIMIDCSHDNSGKDPRLQPHVLRSVIQQRLDGNHSIIGVMLESHLEEGNQPVKNGGLKYGVSITDPCLGWKKTEAALLYACEELADGGKRSQIPF
jgi:3-deoxy-7-phosphoheptulonate synthase